MSMKYEELNNENKGNDKGDMSWFPCSQVYNRLMIVAGIIIAIIIAGQQECDNEDEIASIRIGSFFITIVLEVLLYVAIVWIYHGFKNDGK